MSKVISIVGMGFSIVSLCEDGSIWMVDTSSKHWVRFPNVGEMAEEKVDDRLKIEVEAKLRAEAEAEVKLKAEIAAEYKAYASFLGSKIVDLDISSRAKNALKKVNIHTISQLILITEEQLRCLPFVGEKSVYEIKQALAQYGFTMADEHE